MSSLVFLIFILVVLIFDYRLSAELEEKLAKEEAAADGDGDVEGEETGTNQVGWKKV